MPHLAQQLLSGLTGGEQRPGRAPCPRALPVPHRGPPGHITSPNLYPPLGRGHAPSRRVPYLGQRLAPAGRGHSPPVSPGPAPLRRADPGAAVLRGRSRAPGARVRLGGDCTGRARRGCGTAALRRSPRTAPFARAAPTARPSRERGCRTPSPTRRGPAPLPAAPPPSARGGRGHGEGLNRKPRRGTARRRGSQSGTERRPRKRALECQ
ncbi:EZH inhibitory protein-like [Equus przewalskii]|uniref:EZH inhibitory protein-like n=1 Tax=Equus przewalskii TaxID=9798 RepID=A0ABM4M5H1_EQUPR